MAMIKCPECGREISDKAASCPGCGVPIGITHTSDSQPENTPSKQKDSTVKIIFGILAIILAFLTFSVNIGFIILLLIDLVAFGIAGMLTDK